MEDKLIPYEAVKIIDACRVHVVAPHPDDEVFGCGGAILSYVYAGIKVDVSILSSGEQAGEPEVRELESLAAAKVLGYGAPTFWRLPDRKIAYSEKLVERLIAEMESAGSDLIFAPSPWEVHPDHRQASMIATEAVRRLGSAVRLAFYEVGVPLRPNVLLDITPHLFRKKEAMACFVSQMTKQDYSRHVLGLNTFRSYTLSPDIISAEAYFLISSQELLLDAFYGQINIVSPGVIKKNDLRSRTTNDFPLVSVLVRSIDRQELMQALDSISLQTYKNIEIVVIAAKPAHSQLPSSWGACKLNLHQTDVNLDRSQAANKAIRCASGDYFLILDDDDWLFPDHVSKLVSKLIYQPNTLAAYTGVMLVDSKGAPTGQVFDVPFDMVRLHAGNLMPIHAVLFSAKILQSGLWFDESLDVFEDWDFWLRLSRLGTIVHVPGVSAAYRVHESSGVHSIPMYANVASHAIHLRWRDMPPMATADVMHRAWEFTNIEIELGNSRTQLSEAEKKIISLQGSLEEIQKENSAIISSQSWRLTRPLRKFSQIIRRIKKINRKSAESIFNRILYRSRTRFGNFPSNDFQYGKWLTDQNKLLAKKIHFNGMDIFSYRPLMSIIMPVYNPPIVFLKEAIESVQAQIYDNWELCIADDASTDPRVWQVLDDFATKDARIKIKKRENNGHISEASNTAISLASGEFLVLFDNDDLLSSSALYCVVEELNKNPSAKILYSDEDKIDAGGRHFGPYLKPDWNYTLFLGHNMISHLGVYHADLVRSVGGFRTGFEGSQDYDLAFRCIELLSDEEVIHIPRVLYHWRAIEGSTALTSAAKPYALDAARRAIQEHRDRVGKFGSVQVMPSLNYKILRPGSTSSTKISLIRIHPSIENSSRSEYFNDWYSEEKWGFSEVLNCSRNSDELNDAIRNSKGDVIFVARVDLMPDHQNSFFELIQYALESDTGVVGGTVRDGKGLLKSGGVILNSENIASVLMANVPEYDPGYMGRCVLAQELSAVSLDCFAFRKDVFKSFGEFPENLPLQIYGFTDWCLNLRKNKLKVIWCPQSTWRAGGDRFDVYPQIGEELSDLKKMLIEKYPEWMQNDPAYHPALSANRADFSFK